MIRAMPKKTLAQYAAERLTDLDAELRELRTRIAVIENEYQYLTAALSGEVPAVPYVAAPDFPSTQPDMAARIVCGSGHPWDIDDIVESALRRFGKSIPRRSMNTTLYRLQEKGVLYKRSDGLWQESSDRVITVHRTGK